MKTEHIVWSRETGYKQEELAKAAEILRQGGLVAFPTETVYGLGGNGLLKEASKKIYEAKGRPSDNPLILHISKKEELLPIVQEVPPMAEVLIEQFWPGPMTLVFKKNELVPYETTGGLDTVAVRMPAHNGALQLIEEAGVPVAAPSANTSGRPSPTMAEHVKEDLDDKIDMIVDGGSVGIGLESTIIDVTGDVPVILRPGYITKEMLEEVLEEVEMDSGLREDTEEAPKAPGMKYRHYAPKAHMTVYEGEITTVAKTIHHLAQEYPAEKVGILATEETKDLYTHGQVVVAGSREKNTVGQELYRALREFDSLDVDVIFSESFSEDEKSEAIMNRLLKAAGQRMVIVPERNAGNDKVMYNKVIFVCQENVHLSPMAEWIMKSILMDKSISICSRGLVVLFPEPRNMKVTDLLINHGVPCEEQTSKEFSMDEVTDETLVIAMSFLEKVKIVEDFQLSDNVFTLKEFVEEEGEIIDPYGGDEEVYEASYVELKDLLYKMKKKLEWN